MKGSFLNTYFQVYVVLLNRFHKVYSNLVGSNHTSIQIVSDSFVLQIRLNFKIKII